MLCALSLSVLGASLAPQGLGSSTAPVVINEFAYDTDGGLVDTTEFVELYNRSGMPVDISGWTLASENPTGPTASFTVPAGTVLPAGGFWVMGSMLVPNVNQVVGTTAIWGNGPDSHTLLDTGMNVVDTVAYETRAGIWNPAVIEGSQGIWGNLRSASIEQSWCRAPDGYDDNSNGRDFWALPSTPGAANIQNLPPLLFENYDGLILGSDVANWGESFVKPRVIDPTVVDTNNPNAIPASPQGGQAVVHWDPTGGGNYTIYTAAIGPGQVFDAWVYFDAVPEAAGETETWSVGFGTGATFFNIPDPSGSLGTTFNGNTGVTWTYQVTDLGGTLYLVDHNDGGWPAGGAVTPPTVITQIPIQVGVNDGWRRLRLEVAGLRLVIAQFDGGTPIVFAPYVECCNAGCFPCGSGTNCPTECADPTTLRSHDFLYVGYREAVTNNLSVRPFTMDDLVLRPSSAGLAYQSTSAPSTVGTPVIAANSPPIVGNSGFAVESHNLTNSPIGLFLVAFSPATLNLQPLGGQAGAVVLSQGTLLLRGAANNMSSLPVSIPSSMVFVGNVVYWQAADLDAALGIPIPVANSRILSTTIGAL